MLGITEFLMRERGKLKGGNVGLGIRCLWLLFF